MEIYLMRHGEALSPHDWREGDNTRPLSNTGKHQVQKALDGMKKNGFKPEIILTSPFVRAQQTAEIVKQLGEDVKVEKVNDLRSGASVKVIHAGVVPYQEYSRVLVVGHMPDMALFGSGLTLEAQLMERHLEPGEIWAFNVSGLDQGWGTGKMIWEKKISDWN